MESTRAASSRGPERLQNSPVKSPPVSEGFCDARRRPPDAKEASNEIRVSPPMMGWRHAFGPATFVAPQPVTVSALSTLITKGLEPPGWPPHRRIRAMARRGER